MSPPLLQLIIIIVGGLDFSVLIYSFRITKWRAQDTEKKLMRKPGY
jgi:hypothetical protein